MITSSAHTRLVLRLAFVACVGLLTAPAHAATLGYSLAINDPVFNATNGNLNVPDFQLTNTSATGASITDFQMTIGNTAFNFDFVRNQSVFADTGTPLSYSLNSVGLINNGNGDDVLQYSFLGFDPGDIFRFEVDIDPDGPGFGADFRDVMFPVATALVTFSDGSTAGSLFNPSDPTQTSFEFEEIIPAPVPLPGGLPLLLGALGIAALITRRRSPVSA